MVGLGTLLRPIMTTLFIALLSLRNSLASDARFKKKEKQYFFLFSFPLFFKRILAEVDFPRRGLRTTNPHHLQKKTKALLRKDFYVEKPSDRNPLRWLTAKSTLFLPSSWNLMDVETFKGSVLSAQASSRLHAHLSVKRLSEGRV